jgi:hypothetical protein
MALRLDETGFGDIKIYQDTEASVTVWMPCCWQTLRRRSHDRKAQEVLNIACRSGDGNRHSAADSVP